MRLIEEQDQQLSPFDLQKEHLHLSLEDINKLDTKYNYRNYLTYYHHPKLNFTEWLVGFTDGDGDYTVSLRRTTDNVNYKTIHEFRITQSLYNVQSLLFIKDNLGCGNIRPLHPSRKTKSNFPGVRYVD